MNKTRLTYVEHLNESAPPYHSGKWIMFGVQRYSYENRFRFGDILRLYNPVAFEYGFSKWSKELVSTNNFEL